jgi:hypothetical protein
MPTQRLFPYAVEWAEQKSKQSKIKVEQNQSRAKSK